MSDLVPAPATRATLLGPFADPGAGGVMRRLAAFVGQPAIRRVIPWFLLVTALGGAALAWSAIAPAPQRQLYGELGDHDRAGVVAALDKAAIAYRIDPQTGALSVGESDYYRARMLVASDNAVPTPESGAALLDKLPIGASRTLEGERLREAREHDLVLTIMQIDGVESARVHLAEAQPSVFVRDEAAPTASVMVRLSRGRGLADSQVSAIVNLVAASVPGLSADAVRVIDQGGRLLTQHAAGDADRVELQARIEDKLRGQVAQLLTPMLGDGNFSSEIQVELDMDQVTLARESYDKQGALRSESAQQSQSATPPVGGVPGALSNTPPPAATARIGAPQPTPTPTPTASPGATPVNTDSTTQRSYELGREVSVSNAAPGKLKRLSVAVAISAAAAKGSKPADLAQLKQLITAAVGANPARGDQVEVMVRGFEPVTTVPTPFYEAAWFATLARSVGGVIAVALVLLLGVRPLIGAMRAGAARAAAAASADPVQVAIAAPAVDPETDRADAELLGRKVGIAQRLASEKPDAAAAALQQMLSAPAREAA